jgi:hypothetical protein
MFSLRQQAAMARTLCETGAGSTGVLERGEYAKVKHAYLGGLTGSVSREAKRYEGLKSCKWRKLDDPPEVG